MVIYDRLETAWLAGYLANGWHALRNRPVSAVPATTPLRTSGSLAEEHQSNGTAIVGLAPGMNGSGGDNASTVSAQADASTTSAATPIAIHIRGRPIYRLGKSFDLGQMRRLELLAESFNLFNHQNVTELETPAIISIPAAFRPSHLNFLTGLKPIPPLRPAL